MPHHSHTQAASPNHRCSSRNSTAWAYPMGYFLIDQLSRSAPAVAATAVSALLIDGEVASDAASSASFATGCAAADSCFAYLSKPNPRKIVAADRKSTRLNSSHSQISYAVFCLKKKTLSSHRSQPRLTLHHAI